MTLFQQNLNLRLKLFFVVLSFVWPQLLLLAFTASAEWCGELRGDTHTQFDNLIQIVEKRLQDPSGSRLSHLLGLTAASSQQLNNLKTIFGPILGLETLVLVTPVPQGNSWIFFSEDQPVVIRFPPGKKTHRHQAREGNFKGVDLSATPPLVFESATLKHNLHLLTGHILHPDEALEFKKHVRRLFGIR